MLLLGKPLLCHCDSSNLLFPATCFYHEPYKLHRSMVFTRFVSVTFLGNIKFRFNSEPNRRIKRWPENVELHVLIALFFICRVILSVLVLKFLFSFVCCFELKLLKAQPCWKVLVRYVFDTFAQRNYTTSTSTLTHDGLVYDATDTHLWTQYKMAALTVTFSPASSIRPSLINVMVFVVVNKKKEEVVFSRLSNAADKST